MIVTIIGAGGVGGYLGMRLLQAGHDARFLVRGRTCEALRSRGLTVNTPSGPVAIPNVTASEFAKELGPCDLVVVTVKNYDLGSGCAEPRAPACETYRAAAAAKWRRCL